MADFIPIYKDRDFYVPAFEIRVNNQLLPNYASKDVIEVQYKDNVDEIDSFEITINNWDTEKLDFKYTGGARKNNLTERNLLFDPGQVIELWMGYFKPTKENPNPLRLMLIGKINSLTPNFPSSGQPTLKVSGKNVLIQFKSKQETHKYPNKTDSQIAEEIGQKRPLKDTNGNKIPIVVNRDARDKNESNQKYTLQKNQLDIVFLMQLAQRNSYELIFINDVKDPQYQNLKPYLNEQKPPPFLYFGPSLRLAKVSYLLEWGKSLIQFQPTLTTTNQVSQVTVQGWDSLKKKPIKVTIKRSDLDIRSQKDKQREQKLEEGFDKQREIVVDRPVFNEKDAKQLAIAMMKDNVQNMVTGRGSTVGTADLRAGSFVQIQGLGLTFSGKYFIKSTTHTINASGYITEFEARKEEENK
ncbi:MAG: hypothetical protein V7K69_20850 [Nostoc sp.]|uniref:phage late control D family protein n=1 Tax=Nostoc sp. TaxID=1180 RepID=UPI002FF51C5E